MAGEMGKQLGGAQGGEWTRSAHRHFGPADRDHLVWPAGSRLARKRRLDPAAEEVLLAVNHDRSVPDPLNVCAW